MKRLGDKIHVKDEKTIEDLFKMFFPRLCSYAVTFVKNDANAADLVQEVFIKIWDKKLTFANLLNFKVYAYNSVKNACLNHIRDNASKTSITGMEDQLSDIHESGNAVIESEIANMIFDAINELPEARKEVMLMKLKGMKLQEIADNLDLNIQTVKNYVSIAHKELKPKLKDLYIYIL